MAYDETLSSWLYRCALNKSFSGINSDDLPSDRWVYFSQGSDAEDMDFAACARDYNKIRDKLSFVRHFEWETFNPETKFLLSPDFRHSFCPHCLYDDVKTISIPAWQKRWCYVASPCCEIHQVLLSMLNIPIKSSKAWDAFSYYAETKNNIEHNVRALHASILLSIRVQRWILTLHKKNTLQLPFNNGDVSVESLHDASRRLMELFLSVKTSTHDAGVARWLLTRERSYIARDIYDARESRFVGAMTSTPRQRMTALLFVGWIFGLFSQVEIVKLRAELYCSGFEWPRSVTALGQLANCFRTRKEYIDYRQQFELMPLPIFYALRDFFVELDIFYEYGVAIR